jgi:Colicin D
MRLRKLMGEAKKRVYFTLFLASALGTEAFLPTILSMIKTAGFGSAAQAGKLGVFSKPIFRTMQVGGAFGSGTSIGQGISGKNMFTGEDLSAFDRGFHLTFGAAGATLDLGGAGLRPGNLSQSMPTVTNALEGISAPQVTRTGGRLGLSMEGGSIKLGGTPDEVPKGGKIKPEVVKAKGSEPIEVATKHDVEPVSSGAKISMQKLEKKWKHAIDFGITTTKRNASTLADFQKAIVAHLDDTATVVKGTYQYVEGSKVYFSPNTNLVVILDSTGNFVSGWKREHLKVAKVVKNQVFH